MLTKFSSLFLFSTLATSINAPLAGRGLEKLKEYRIGHFVSLQQNQHSEISTLYGGSEDRALTSIQILLQVVNVY